MPGILVLGRGIADAPVSGGPRIDLVGSALSALGLGLFAHCRPPATPS